MDKDSVVQFKSEYIAILQRRYGAQVEFIVMAFKDLTKEGYRLMAIDEGKESSFASGGINSYYYFQKIKYVCPINILYSYGCMEKTQKDKTLFKWFVNF